MTAIVKVRLECGPAPLEGSAQPVATAAVTRSCVTAGEDGIAWSPDSTHIDAVKILGGEVGTKSGVTNAYQSASHQHGVEHTVGVRRATIAAGRVVGENIGVVEHVILAVHSCAVNIHIKPLIWVPSVL